MRAFSAALCVAACAATSESDGTHLPHLPHLPDHLPHHMPWYHTTTIAPTHPPTVAGDVEEFVAGFAEGLGLSTVRACGGDLTKTVDNIEEIVALYRKGGIIAKAKAAEKILGTATVIVKAVAECVSSVQDVEKLDKIKKELADKHLRTMSGAVGIVLSAVQDHADFDAFVAAWGQNYEDAGRAFASAISTILGSIEENSSGVPAVAVARGLLTGLMQATDLPCIDDAKVDVEHIVTGLKALATGNLPKGITTLLHAVAEVLPMIDDCPKDRPAIAALLKHIEELKDPIVLAKTLEKNMLHDKARLAAGVAGAALAYVGKDWTRFGAVVGNLVGKLLLEEDELTTTTKKPEEAVPAIPTPTPSPTPSPTDMAFGHAYRHREESLISV